MIPPIRPPRPGPPGPPGGGIAVIASEFSTVSVGTGAAIAATVNSDRMKLFINILIEGSDYKLNDGVDKLLEVNDNYGMEPGSLL
jgi:hypothetical protein